MIRREHLVATSALTFLLLLLFILFTFSSLYFGFPYLRVVDYRFALARSEQIEDWPPDEEARRMLAMHATGSRCLEAGTKIKITSKDELNTFVQQIEKCSKTKYLSDSGWTPKRLHKYSLNFEAQMLVGLVTSGSCGARHSRKFLHDNESKRSIFWVRTTGGFCMSGPAKTSLNLVVAPTIPDQFQTEFRHTPEVSRGSVEIIDSK